MWGVNKQGCEIVDKIFLWYLRMILRVKATTSNVITIGECGKFPPSVTCHVDCILYFLRLRDMANTSLVNIAFQEQRRLHSLGFVTWYGKVCELARSYGIDLNHTNCSKTQIRHVTRSFFVRKWQESVADINKIPNSTDLCKVQIQLWHRIVPGQCEKSSIQGSNIKAENQLTRLGGGTWQTYQTQNATRGKIVS